MCQGAAQRDAATDACDLAGAATPQETPDELLPPAFRRGGREKASSSACKTEAANESSPHAAVGRLPSLPRARRPQRSGRCATARYVRPAPGRRQKGLRAGSGRQAVQGEWTTGRGTCPDGTGATNVERGEGERARKREERERDREGEREGERERALPTEECQQRVGEGAAASGQATGATRKKRAKPTMRSTRGCAAGGPRTARGRARHGMNESGAQRNNTQRSKAKKPVGRREAPNKEETRQKRARDGRYSSRLPPRRQEATEAQKAEDPDAVDGSTRKQKLRQDCTVALRPGEARQKLERAAKASQAKGHARSNGTRASTLRAQVSARLLPPKNPKAEAREDRARQRPKRQNKRVLAPQVATTAAAPVAKWRDDELAAQRVLLARGDAVPRTAGGPPTPRRARQQAACRRATGVADETERERESVREREGRRAASARRRPGPAARRPTGSLAAVAAGKKPERNETWAGARRSDAGRPQRQGRAVRAKWLAKLVRLRCSDRIVGVDRLPVVSATSTCLNSEFNQYVFEFILVSTGRLHELSLTVPPLTRL